ncbi:MAG: Asp-tRNA(Asn)/Glu-tRNA(Gln) amidotransferase subunit GatC [bacterium]|nr:Asp-tRNA(Asn)/Glu-tRNA(Gln) amidotransferase subunit GatC [bacterium]
MIDAKEIEHLAELARIEVGKEETVALAKDIEAILGYVTLVQKVAGGTEVPDGHTEHTPVNVMREDVNPHESGIYTDALLSLAPERDGQYVKVKKIL